MELRPAVFSKGRVIVIGAIGVAVFGLFFVLPRYVRYRDHRDAVEREAAEAPYRNEQAQLEQQLAARFAPIASLTGTGPERCPPTVTGPLQVIQQAWLASALSPDVARNGPRLSSPALLYWTHEWSASDVHDLAAKSAAERALLEAKYIVLIATESSAVKETGEYEFKGGEIKGDVLVVDVGATAIVCAGAIDTQPTFVVALKQDTADGDKWAMQSAESDAVKDAFWTGLTAQLAQMAPGAQLIKGT